MTAIMKAMGEGGNGASAFMEDYTYHLVKPLSPSVTATSRMLSPKRMTFSSLDTATPTAAWCHTFSPSKMWINGFANLQKPYCHFATQYNREISDIPPRLSPQAWPRQTA